MEVQCSTGVMKLGVGDFGIYTYIYICTHIRIYIYVGYMSYVWRKKKAQQLTNKNKQIRCYFSIDKMAS